jgi:hypothetical protein
LRRRSQRLKTGHKGGHFALFPEMFPELQQQLDCVAEWSEFEPSVPVVNVPIAGGNNGRDASSEAIAKESNGL